MKPNKSIKISLRIIGLFALAIFLSFIPDYLHTFFGDFYCNGLALDHESGKMEYYWHYGQTHHNWEWHWGYRHWLFLCMGVSLAIVQVVNIINAVDQDE